MPVIGTILRTELLLLWRERTLQTVSALTLALVAVAFAHGVVRVQRQQARVVAARNEQAELYRTATAKLEQGAMDTNDLRDETARFRAVLPPAPLAVLAVGQTDVLPQSFLFQPDENAMISSPYPIGEHVLYGLYAEPAIGNPRALWNGNFDLAFLTIYICPLLIIALTYNLTSAEREDGALSLILSQPVAPAALALGKVLARWLPVLIFGALLPAVAASALGGGVRPALFAWLTATVLYQILWLAAAVYVNARASSSLRNILTLGTLWLAIVVVIPAACARIVLAVDPQNAILEFADAVRPVPIQAYETSQATARWVREEFDRTHPLPPDAPPDLRDSLWRSEPCTIPPGKTPLRSYLQTHAEWPAHATCWQVSPAIGLARVEFIENALAAPALKLAEDREKTRKLSSFLTYLSPAAVMQRVTGDIAGSSEARHRRFLAQIDAYVRERQAFFVRKIAANEAVAPAEVSNLPLFEFPKESSAEQSVQTALTVLGRSVCSLE